AHQGGAEALVLAFRQNGHRSQSEGRDHPALGDNGQVAEQNMADDLSISLGYERGSNIAAVPKGVHQPGLGILTEGETVHLSDGLVVAASFRSNQWIHARGP